MLSERISGSEPKEPCRHDKGVEVHQGEVYCFHCGEHLGKAIKKSELKRGVFGTAFSEKGCEEIRKDHENFTKTIKEQAKTMFVENQWQDMVSVKVVLGVYAKGLFSAEKPPLKTSELLQEWDKRPRWVQGLPCTFSRWMKDNKSIDSLEFELWLQNFGILLAKTEAQRNKKLTDFYNNLKANIEVDEKSGYHILPERKQLLKTVEALLGAETEPFSVKASPKTPCDNNPEFSCKYPVAYREKHCRKSGYCPYGKDSGGC